MVAPWCRGWLSFPAGLLSPGGDELVGDGGSILAADFLHGLQGVFGDVDGGGAGELVGVVGRVCGLVVRAVVGD